MRDSLGGALLPMEEHRLFTRGQILLFVAGYSICVLGISRLYDIVIARRLREWAQSQGYEFINWEWPPFAGTSSLFFNPTCYFVVRDPAGARKWARAQFVGLSLAPTRVEVEWVDSRDHRPVSRTLRVIAIILGFAGVLMVADLLFG